MRDLAGVGTIELKAGRFVFAMGEASKIRQSGRRERILFIARLQVRWMTGIEEPDGPAYVRI